ncbi:MAG: hypothetical protein NPIRA02_10750 [Nitrospirales bacterium]|nr:MAG: hypothetical protein NPIRA02_10750 [Nitrospirales bacterium]
MDAQMRRAFTIHAWPSKRKIWKYTLEEAWRIRKIKPDLSVGKIRASLNDACVGYVQPLYFTEHLNPSEDVPELKDSVALDCVGISTPMAESVNDLQRLLSGYGDDE